MIIAHREVYKINEYSVPPLIQRMGWIFYHCGNNFILGLWKHWMKFLKKLVKKTWVALSYDPDKDLFEIHENTIVSHRLNQVGTLIGEMYDEDFEQMS